MLLVMAREMVTTCGFTDKQGVEHPGCGATVVKIETNEPNQWDPTKKKWETYDPDKITLHFRNCEYYKAKKSGIPYAKKTFTPAQQQEQLIPPGQTPKADPIMQQPNYGFLEKQVATLSTVVDSLLMRVEELEKDRMLRDSKALVNTSEDELGEDKDE